MGRVGSMIKMKKQERYIKIIQIQLKIKKVMQIQLKINKIRQKYKNFTSTIRNKTWKYNTNTMENNFKYCML